MSHPSRTRQPLLRDPALWSPPSALGLLLGALGFVAALTPSLVPRDDLLQGVVAGLGFIIAYALVALLRWAARWLQLLPPLQPHSHWRRRDLPVLLGALAVLGWGLWHAADWQSGVRAVMAMPPVDGFRPLIVALAAGAVVFVLLLAGRLFRRAWLLSARMLAGVLPLRLALLSGFVAAALLFWAIGSGILIQQLVNRLDDSYAAVDAFIPADEQPPASHAAADWQHLGAQGRRMLLGTPTAAEISALSARPAQTPLRVYVGINSADDPRARAELALATLKRDGAFSRKALLIATPTGTGWIDPAALRPLEYLLDGDLATVAVQYSYLPSWLSLLVEPERGAETARELFRLIYQHWAALPAAQRPRLYLFGLSLGALNSDLAVNVYDLLGAPIDGALWAGPPFPSRSWQQVVRERVADTPVWAPRYSDGRMFRFRSQQAASAEDYAPWGPMRVIYLQYPSDPIVFFEPRRVFNAPRIAQAPRPPDIATDFRWIPFVSYMQLLVDMMTAASTPRGYGHVYAAEHYLACWLELIDSHQWSAQALDALRARLAADGL